ncbi:MAG: hemin uptake protein HemP [Planctomycetes bacterium]|nr:hemin uptake protein HemP [Planctomycetota bacterium]
MAEQQPEHSQKVHKPAEQESSEPPRVLSAKALFAGRREVCIEHDGERYVLRITRRGKLILQK